MKYLVCADGSPPAYKALDMVYQLYNKDNDSVVILTVAGVEEHFWQDAATKEEQKKKAKEAGDKILADFTTKANEMGFTNVEGISEVGCPRDTILHIAETNGVDVVAMGARGLGAVKRLLVGSVSDYVMKNASCNVLIAKTAETQ
eukprot:CAMPEP_0117041546 /NCGR_PEP_ID=MMETSP0472-20121206/29002_1 /TAXON_ID=693140 ORGANISM="Tiarina fusus, Strain LIS" /NCGR_SAMPLE_ID=MMETSP0472 /ASSEMBLY_ACC=CAM_ASM_000603 /LENGTH=144 /DNA_ID=CAMNT_0004752575 /DNA_START=29 /DNA_END=463 /DNA_ORIENTATION=+